MRIKAIIANLSVACVAFSMPAFAQQVADGNEALGERDTATQEISSEDWLTDTLLAYAPHGEGHEHKDFIKELSITDAQLEKLAALKSQYEDQTGAKKAQLHSMFRKMRELMGQPTVDRGAVMSVHNKAQALKDELSTMHVNYMLDRSEVFTADQRSQMHHWMLVHQFSHGGGGHHHGHDGGEHEHNHGGGG